MGVDGRKKARDDRRSSDNEGNVSPLAGPTYTPDYLDRSPSTPLDLDNRSPTYVPYDSSSPYNSADPHPQPRWYNVGDSDDDTASIPDNEQSKSEKGIYICVIVKY